MNLGSKPDGGLNPGQGRTQDSPLYNPASCLGVCRIELEIVLRLGIYNRNLAYLEEEPLILAIFT
jgi:hypothetical protein